VVDFAVLIRRIMFHSRISERPLELLALPNNGVPKQLLDIGSGSGLSGETMTEHGRHWIGYDISKAILGFQSKAEYKLLTNPRNTSHKH